MSAPDNAGEEMFFTSNPLGLVISCQPEHLPATTNRDRALPGGVMWLDILRNSLP
jgi:hypothetical protein